MRRVKVLKRVNKTWDEVEDYTDEFRYKMQRIVKKSGIVTEEDGEASFHQWSLDFEELRDGVGPIPVAIIERDDGSIEIIHATLIKFIDKMDDLLY